MSLTPTRHTTSGIIGIKAAFEVLSAAGRTDVVLAMLAEDDYPSYGYMLRGGQLGAEPATTLWELWDSDQQGPGMNSRNHIMFGTVGSWMYKHLLGGDTSRARLRFGARAALWSSLRRLQPHVRGGARCTRPTARWSYDGLRVPPTRPWSP